jgi:uroporphyrinogen-III decarboxylase
MILFPAISWAISNLTLIGQKEINVNKVKRLIETVGKNNGYILGTGHIIQADVPIKNIS